MKFSVYIFVAVLLLVLIAIRIAPRQYVDIAGTADPAAELQLGGVDDYLAAAEAQIADIKPHQQKRVDWAAAPERKTDIAIVYLHGFSASSGEIAPVPEELAESLNANIYFTRLAGHGIKGAEAMHTAKVNDWVADTKEALTIGNLIGDRVVVIGTSTGGSLLALAMQDDELSAMIDDAIYISPNFAVQAPTARLVYWPWFEKWGPKLAGEYREWDALNALQEEFWTTRYRSTAVIPMMTLIAAIDPDKAARKHSLFIVDPRDRVVKAEKSLEIARAWRADIVNPSLGADDDPFFHVLAGDALSPSQNERLVTIMHDWILAD